MRLEETMRKVVSFLNGKQSPKPLYRKLGGKKYSEIDWIIFCFYHIHASAVICQMNFDKI